MYYSNDSAVFVQLSQDVKQISQNWFIGWVRLDSHGLFEIFQVSIVAVLKRIDTLCQDYFWRESVPEVDDPVGEEVRSCGAVLFAIWSLNLCLWPLVLLAAPLSLSELVSEFGRYQLIWLMLLANLKYWIRSPRCLLAFRVVRPSCLSLSVYLRYFSSGTILVALLWTLSMARMSCFRYGHHTLLAYSRCGRTNTV